jgi:hypothetical protein
MQRFRVSAFQRSILETIRDSQHDGCSPQSRDFKERLYGKPRGFTTAQRVTLCRSLQRLEGRDMIVDSGHGWYRLSDKGRAWLSACEPVA